MVRSALLPVLLAIAAVCHADASVSSLASAAAASGSASANPIRRVVTLLQGMASKITKEGEREKQLYDKFMCFCKKNGFASISENDEKNVQVGSELEEAQAKLQQSNLDIKAVQVDLDSTKAALNSATKQRETEHKENMDEAADIKAYISTLESALDNIRNGKSGTFLQAHNMGTALLNAVASSVTVSEYDRKMVSNFVTGTGVYVPKKGVVAGILQQMKDEAEKNLAAVEAEEASQAQNYKEMMAAKGKQAAGLKDELGKKFASISDLEVSKQDMKQDLADTSEAVSADKKLAADIQKDCRDKERSYQERVKLRGEELIAVQDTIKILNDDDALEVFKKTLPPSTSLLQVRTTASIQRSRALAIVRGIRRKHSRSSTTRPDLDLLVLALKGGKADFSKVKMMIDDMVKTLQQEQVNDDAEKEFCGAQMANSEDKIKRLAKSANYLTLTIDEKKEALDSVDADIDSIISNAKKLDKAVESATTQRKEEDEEFQELMSSNSAAKELLQFAKDRLDKFYNPASSEPKKHTHLLLDAGSYDVLPSSVDKRHEVISLAEISSHAERRVVPATMAMFGQMYKKKVEAESHVISMINLLIRDLDQEVRTARSEEKRSQDEYEEMVEDAKERRISSAKSLTEKRSVKAEVEDALVTRKNNLESEKKKQVSAEEYKMKLHSQCDFLLSNYDLRKSARSDEMEALKETKATLAGAMLS